MTALKDNTVIRVKEKDGTRRQIGKVFGDTFVAFERDEEKHLFRGGANNAKEAMVHGTAAWGLDMAVMDSLLSEYGIKFVEIPTKRCRYRTRLETLVGPKAFTQEFGGHRPQYLLPLSYWAEIPTNDDEQSNARDSSKHADRGGTSPP